MNWTAVEILSVLDQCAADSVFPMLDNGYFYLAATRLNLYRSDRDWALVVETFAYSPRMVYPSTQIETFASCLHNRKSRADYVNKRAYKNYLRRNPQNESQWVNPIEEGSWIDPEDEEWLAPGTTSVCLRGRKFDLPARCEWADLGVPLADPDRVQVFELCRLLAAMDREAVLASEAERRTNVLPEMEPLLQLDDWHHPDLAAGEKPSDSETFCQLCEVLETGEVGRYRHTCEGNTHWRNWPEGGAL